MIANQAATNIGSTAKLFLLLTAAVCCVRPVSAEELQERQELQQLGQHAYQVEDFASLDATLGTYLKSQARTSSGLWKFGMVQAGVESTSEENEGGDEPHWASLEAKARRRIAANPQSPFARINLAHVVVGHAWAIRGGAYAVDVPETAWKPFHLELARARRLLDEAKPIAACDPAWYDLAIEIAKADGRKRAEVDSLFDEATAREPSYYPVYFSMLNYLLPKWNGDLHQIEQFANKAVARSRSIEGNSMYARIYWFASEVQFENGLFASSFARWDRVDAGFKDVMARYPDQWNLNHYAKFACLADDMKRTRELIGKIDQPIDEAWQPKGLFEHCRSSAGMLSL